LIAIVAGSLVVMATSRVGAQTVTPTTTPVGTAPEISVEFSTHSARQIACEGSFAITIRNSGFAGSTLVIDYFRLADEYGGGRFYGDGFTFDDSKLQAPISLSGEQSLVIPVQYRLDESPSMLQLFIHSNSAHNADVSDAVIGSVCCVGDCDGNSAVEVHEVIALVNVGLGTAETEECLGGIPGDATVNIAMLVQAVNNALNGCPAAF
jgi:hypothetical protein